MRLLYNDVDITEKINIREAAVRDAAGKRCDSMDITLADASDWYRWAPMADDRLELIEGGYRSGICYINTITPCGNDYRILATACRTDCYQKNYDTYTNKTLSGLLAACAAECKMGSSIYGLSGDILYGYLQRDMESCPGLLARIAELEGAVLKTWNGKMTLIGIEAAQELPAMEEMTITTDLQQVSYERRESEKWRSVTIVAGGKKITVADRNAKWGRDKVLTETGCSDAGTAGRWARGLLLSHNRRAERLTVNTKLHTGWSAMVRIDINGGTDADGSWVIDEVTHDLKNGISRAELVRAYTIGE